MIDVRIHYTRLSAVIENVDKMTVKMTLLFTCAFI